MGLDRRTFLVTAAASGAMATPAAAQATGAVPARPPSRSDDTQQEGRAMGRGGFSESRLGKMHEVMAGYVAGGTVPGLVTLVSRRGEVHVEAIGARAIGGAPVGRDSIFRITSMTKPITAVAA